MNERLKELAEQAGATVYKAMHGKAISFLENDLERFADLVRQDEREACAKIALKYEPTERQPYVTYAADEIRARGDRTKTSRDICGND
jgi:hypothetical protein